MKKQARVSGRLVMGNQGHFDFHLPLIIFEEDGSTICYCPALDLAGYGANEQEALESYKIVMAEYFEYTFRKKTLSEDLRRIGWIVKKSMVKKMVPPPDSKLLETNEEFRRVFNNFPYKKITTPVQIPAYA